MTYAQHRPDALFISSLFTALGIVLLVPANILPIMTVIKLGQGEPSTIATGVAQLLHHGLYGIAILVLVASIVVPMLKLSVLASLLVAIRFNIALSARQCTILFRFVKAIGPWSMLDLFIIALLVSLVDLGNVAQISAENGASAFAGVVVATMIAASQFDCKRLWALEAKTPSAITVAADMESIND